MHRLSLQATYVHIDHQISATPETCLKKLFSDFLLVWF